MQYITEYQGAKPFDTKMRPFEYKTKLGKKGNSFSKALFDDFSRKIFFMVYSVN